MDYSPQDQGAIERIMVIRDRGLLKNTKFTWRKKSIKYVYAAQIINKTKISVQKGAFLIIARTNYR